MDTHGQQDGTERPTHEADSPIARLKAQAVRELQEWLIAIRGLPDNPLAQCLLLERRRKAQRPRKVVTQMLWLAAYTLPALFVFIGVLFELALTQSPVLGAFVNATLCAGVTVYAVWYFTGVFPAFRDCALALNTHHGNKQPELAVSMLRQGLLTDREVILGFAAFICQRCSGGSQWVR